MRASSGRTTWRLCLAGAGNVGAGLLAMLDDRADLIAERYGVDLVVVGVAELGGAALDSAGLDLALLRRTLAERGSLAGIPGCGRPGMTALELFRACDPDIVLDATPVNLVDGEPGLGLVRAALGGGTHVVLADKGPVALAYDELVALSDLADGWGAGFRGPTGDESLPGGPARPRLRFSATVAGALPVVNLGRRDLAGGEISRIEGVFNGTTHSILRAMADGAEFAEALADAQARGIAEADPSLDIDGHDAAVKLLVTANAVLGAGAKLDDVAVTGIRDVTAADVAAAEADGRRLVLLCLAEQRKTGGYRLSVAPSAVPLDHPLARLHPDEMGIVYYTDRVDRLSAASLEPGPEPASAAMLRDILDIIRSLS